MSTQRQVRQLEVPVSPGVSTADIAVTNSLATCDIIDWGMYADGVMHFAAGYAGGDLDVYACATPDGTYRRLYDRDGVAVTISPAATDIWQGMPLALYAAKYIKLLRVGGADDVVQIMGAT